MKKIVYVVTKEELWGYERDIIGVFETLEAAEKVVPTPIVWEADDGYTTYEEKKNDYTTILWTIEERDLLD